MTEGSRPVSRRHERLRRGRRKTARSIGGAIDAVLDGLGVARVVEQHGVFLDWEKRLGAEIARVSRPHRIDGGTLIVHVENSVWMNELSLRQKELLARLNRGRRRARIERLLFRLDPGTKG